MLNTTLRALLFCILSLACAAGSAQSILAKPFSRYSGPLKAQSEEMFDQGIALIQKAPLLSKGDSLEVIQKWNQSDKNAEGWRLLKESALIGNPKSILFHCVSRGDKSASPAIWSEGLAWCRMVDRLPKDDVTTAQKDEAKAMAEDIERRLSSEQLAEALKTENALNREILRTIGIFCW